MAKKKRELSISEISNLISINKTTTFKILQTLKAHGYIQQNVKNSKYRIGLKIVEMGNDISESIDIRIRARPHLEELRDATNETVNLMVYDAKINDFQGVYIDILQSRQVLRMVSSIGTSEELNTSSVGKAILAHLPENEINSILNAHRLPRRTEKTITDRDEFIKHLAMIRSRGYAIDDEESEYGIKCVGAPIFNHDCEVVGAVSVATPAFRFNVDKISALAGLVMNTAKNISTSIGNGSSGSFFFEE